MADTTKSIRKQMVAELNLDDNTKADLEAKHGKVWTTSEMSAEYEALGFMAPYIIVRKRETGERGSLMFTHSPRFYFNFQPE